MTTEKRKRHQWLLVLTLLLVGGAFTSVHAKSNWTSGQCTVTLSDDGTLKVSKASGSGRMADYDPEVGTGDPAPWYDWSPDLSYEHKIKSIIIEEGVSYIGAYAFENCEGVESVSLPGSLTEIGANAFQGCSFTQITIPANVTVIGQRAFLYCSQLAHIYMYADPDKLSWPEDPDFPDFSTWGTVCHVKSPLVDVFASKFSKRNLTYAGNLDEGYNRWYSGDCVLDLSEEGVLTVSKDGSASSGRMGDIFGMPVWCDRAADIKRIVIAEGVTHIGSFAFWNCNQATEVSIASTVRSIGGSAFQQCSGLTSAGLPDGVTSIGAYAFYGCTGLTSVTIPGTVTYWDVYAFKDCTSVTDVYCYPDPTKLEWWTASNRLDFMADGATRCHVWGGYKIYYERTFDMANVTWVGDLDIPGKDPGIAIDATNFPDENFRQAVRNLGENGGDDYLSDLEVKMVKDMKVSQQGITDLTGIGYFTELERLDVSYNQLTAIDVSQNTSLRNLNCSHNRLTTLDVSQNVNLAVLGCYYNQLTTLDVSHNAMLVSLDCSYNKLTTLNLSRNTSLRQATCFHNEISGAGLAAMLENLPNCGASLYFHDKDSGDEGNSETTPTQRAGLKEKGWTIYYWHDSGWYTYGIQAYDLWIGDVQVTELNRNDVLNDGTVSYDPETCTLDFTSGPAVIDGTYAASKIFAPGTDLTINAPYGLTVENLTGSGIILNQDNNAANHKKLTVNGNVTFNTRDNPVIGCSDMTINGDLTVNMSRLSIYADNITVNGDVTATGPGYFLTAEKSLVLNGTRHEFHATSGYPCLSSKGTIYVNGDLTATSESYHVIKATGDITIGSGTWTLDGGLNSYGNSVAAIRCENGSIVIPESHDIVLPVDGKVGMNDGYYTIVNKNGFAADNHKVIIADREKAISLDEMADNSGKLESHDGKTVSVVINRTLMKESLGTVSWNTFASPFSITDLEGVFGHGVKVKKLVSSSLTGGTLHLTFADAYRIEAGKPYLVRVPDNVNFLDHVVEEATISKAIVPTETDAVDFIPTLGRTAFDGDLESIFFLVSRNRFSYALEMPNGMPNEIYGFRCYFRLKTPGAVRSISMNLSEDDGTTPVDSLAVNREQTADAWYTLDGRKLNRLPTAKGIYIHHGKKTIIK